MTLKKVLLGAMAFATIAVSAQAQGKRYKSNGQRYANIEKITKPESKFSNYAEQEETYPADALYSSVWTSARVNPYDDVTLPDSFLIVTSGYHSPVDNVVTSEYGPRWGRFHAGVDIALHKGDSVRAAYDGQIRIGRKFNKDGYGWYVIIRHENGLETLYGHLSKSLVVEDQKVKAGEVIGLGGSTGRSTGPHLHFETRFLGFPMNPRNIIDFEAQVVKSDTYTIDKYESFRQWYKYKGIRVPRNRNKANNSEIAAVANTENSEVAQSEVKENAEKQVALASAKKTVSHIVKNGENLSTIARQHHTTVAKICQLNNITNPDRLRLNQKLIIEVR